MIKSILSVLTLAMATATIFLGVRGGYAVIASRIDPGVPPVVMEDKESRPVPEKSGASISNFEDIGRRNLFKTVNEAAPAVAEVVKTKDSDPNSLEKTKMKLKLWGTVTGADQMTFAIIEDATEKRQNLFRVGDPVKTAMVKQILRERVVLTVNGKDEALDIEKTVKSEGAASKGPVSPEPPPESAPEPPPEQPEQAEQPSAEPAQEVSVGRQQVEGAIQNVNELMKQVRIRPHFTNGQPDGLSLSGIKPGSIFQDIGLKSGDVIVGVDGRPIQSVDDALKFYTSLKDSKNVALQIRREGRDETIKYSVE